MGSKKKASKSAKKQGAILTDKNNTTKKEEVTYGPEIKPESDSSSSSSESTSKAHNGFTSGQLSSLIFLSIWIGDITKLRKIVQQGIGSDLCAASFNINSSSDDSTSSSSSTCTEMDIFFYTMKNDISSLTFILISLLFVLCWSFEMKLQKLNLFLGASPICTNLIYLIIMKEWIPKNDFIHRLLSILFVITTTFIFNRESIFMLWTTTTNNNNNNNNQNNKSNNNNSLSLGWFNASLLTMILVNAGWTLYHFVWMDPEKTLLLLPNNNNDEDGTSSLSHASKALFYATAIDRMTWSILLTYSLMCFNLSMKRVVSFLFAIASFWQIRVTLPKQEQYLQDVPSIRNNLFGSLLVFSVLTIIPSLFTTTSSKSSTLTTTSSSGLKNKNKSSKKD